MSSPFLPAVSPPQDVNEATIGNLLTRVRILEAQLAGTSSDPQFDIKVFADFMTLSVGDGAFLWAIPADMNGMSLTRAEAYVTTVSSSGLPTVQIRNVTDAVDILSTRITIDVSELTSYTAATPSVVNVANAIVATGDILAIDVDVAGTGAKGLGVVLDFA